MSVHRTIAEKFRAKFGVNPYVYRAPGRVNLIGEHTDYNDGFVMPAAIGFYCWVAAAPRTDRRLVITSEEFPEHAEVDLDARPRRPSKNWSDYLVGVAVELENEIGRASCRERA